MSKFAANQIDDQDTNDTLGADVPEGQVQDDSYTTGTQNEAIPVQGDDAPVEDPIQASAADSDEQLGKSVHYRNASFRFEPLLTSTSTR
jgi:hypothetical protein